MKTALFIFAKDEDKYLDENLDYNLHLGYDDIFVCQNNWRFCNRDSYRDEKRIHFLEFDGEAQQNPAYNKFIEDNWNKYDFGAFFDTDEFLLLKKHSNVKDFLKDYYDVPAIGLNMRFFGDSFLKFDNENFSCIKRFVYSDDKLYPLLKVILNFKLCGEKVRFLNPHIPNVPCVDPNKKIVSRNGNMPNNEENEIAELTHYRNKTYDECLKRKFKNTDAFYGYLERVKDPNSGRINIDVFNKEFEFHNRNNIINPSMIDFYNKIKKNVFTDEYFA